jgi:putative DNA primase/helicase
VGGLRVTRGYLPANDSGNDLYDTGIGVEAFLSLAEPSTEIDSPADLTDEIVRQLSDMIKFVPETNEFLGWNGQIFVSDVESHLRHSICHLGSLGHNRSSLKKLRGRKFIEDVIWHLRNHPKIRRSSKTFDSEAYKLNTPKGIIDLHTGQLSPHRQPSLVTKLTTTSPREERCDRFHQFLDEVTDGDVGLQEFLQVMFGACLSGVPEAHWMAFILGPTRSGKSVIVELLAHIMGSYAHTTDGSLFRKNSNDADANPKLYALMGTRLVIASEVDDGHFDGIMLKQLTGDSHITTRALYQNVVTFPRTFKIIAIGNSIPSFSETSKALEARLNIIPFARSFLGREDFDLPRVLRQEATAGYVLQWLVQGHIKYLNAGRKFPDCSKVLGATRDYFSDQGTPAQWLDERCDLDDGLGPASGYTSVREAYHDYCRWKQDRGEKPLAQKRFLGALPSIQTRKSSVIRLVGVHLRAPFPTEMGDWD